MSEEEREEVGIRVDDWEVELWTEGLGLLKALQAAKNVESVRLELVEQKWLCTTLDVSGHTARVWGDGPVEALHGMHRVMTQSLEERQSDPHLQTISEH